MNDNLHTRPQLAFPALSALLLLTAVSCTSPSARDCERTADCGDAEFCRMGFCVPAVASDDTAPDDRGADGAGRPAGGGSGDDRNRPRDAAALPPVDADASEPVSCDGRPPQPDELVLHEILIDVPGGPKGDANGDGTRDASDDEFVEIVNRSDDRLDLSGLTLLKGGDEKASLEAACLGPDSALVVFGGGSLEGLATSDTDTIFRTATSSLGLTNSGGSLTVLGSNAEEMATYQWESSPSESLTLAPQMTGSTMRPHSELAPGSKASPGTCADGTPLHMGCPASKMRDVVETSDASADADD